MAGVALLSPTPCVHVLLELLLVLVNLFVDVIYASLDPRIRYRSPVCPTARGARAREDFYEHTAFPQDPKCESSRVTPRQPGSWRDAVRLASLHAWPALGCRSGHAQARRHSTYAWVGSPPLRYSSHDQQL